MRAAKRIVSLAKTAVTRGSINATKAIMRPLAVQALTLGSPVQSATLLCNFTVNMSLLEEDEEEDAEEPR